MLKGGKFFFLSNLFLTKNINYMSKTHPQAQVKNTSFDKHHHLPHCLIGEVLSFHQLEYGTSKLALAGSEMNSLADYTGLCTFSPDSCESSFDCS